MKLAKTPNAAVALSMLSMLSVLSMLFVVACGDALTNSDYYGEPLGTVSGAVQLGDRAAPQNPLGVILGWKVQVPQSARWVGQLTDVSAGFPAQYRLDLLQPPPDEALNVDPETGGRLGFAFIALYEDVDRNGEANLYQGTGVGQGGSLSLQLGGPPDGPDRFRGGAETVLLAYAADRFPATSQVGQALGGEVAPGFHLVRVDDKCRCQWEDGEQNWMCSFMPATCSLALLPLDTPVDLPVIDSLDQWAPALTPNWVFPVNLRGVATVGGEVVCGSTPADDCRGRLCLAVIDRPDPPPTSTMIATAEIPEVDLGGGQDVPFEFKGLAAGRIRFLTAMLRETADSCDPPMPADGDPVAAPMQLVLFSGGDVELQLVLGSRWDSEAMGVE